jgi:hypothetical protein
MKLIRYFFTSALVALVVLCCNKPNISQAADAPEVTRVRSTGTGETRDGALVDACRLAVAQVHGGRIIGGLIKTNEKESKSTTINGDTTIASGRDTIIGGSGPQFVETRDATALSFDGLLVRYSLVSQSEPGAGRNQWAVVIDADVLKALPDRFKGRIAVVTPSQAKLEAKTGHPDLAKAIGRAIQSWFANVPQFVLLEREDESDLDEELSRAGGGQTAVAEKSKLSAQKVADIVISFEGGELKWKEKSTSFKTTSRQSHTCEVSTDLVLKVLDVSTKGEIGRASRHVSAKKSSTDPERSREEAAKELGTQMGDALRKTGLEIIYLLK